MCLAHPSQHVFVCHRHELSRLRRRIRDVAVPSSLSGTVPIFHDEAEEELGPEGLGRQNYSHLVTRTASGVQHNFDCAISRHQAVFGLNRQLFVDDRGIQSAHGVVRIAGTLHRRKEAVLKGQETWEQLRYQAGVHE